MSGFIQNVTKMNVQKVGGRIILSALLQIIAKRLPNQITFQINIKNNDNVYGICLIGDYNLQLASIFDENEEVSNYELIIVENLDENKKMSMAVLTAKSVESELVEMDCSGMRENVIIDLNREGRRWEG